MTRAEVVMKAIEKKITWIAAAMILGVTDRHMRRLKTQYESQGVSCFRVNDQRGRVRRPKVPPAEIEKVLKLRQKEGFAEMNVQHFWELVTERHDVTLSYNWTRLVLQKAGLAEKAPARGKYRRKRERRPMRGMMLHIDASTHEWIAGEKKDLVVVMDDADNRVLFAQFFDEEGNESTLQALASVLRKHGRFIELYHDRGAHYGKQAAAGTSSPSGAVQRVLRAFGIKQIFARSPEARGRSERCFGTLQGRLPQELKLEGITTYKAANAYLQRQYIGAHNKKFTVKPAQTESAFVPVVGVDLEMLVSEQHERTVGKDNAVSFENTWLQLPRPTARTSWSGLVVLVHELLDRTLAVSWNAKEIARFSRDGTLLKRRAKKAA